MESFASVPPKYRASYSRGSAVATCLPSLACSTKPRMEADLPIDAELYRMGNVWPAPNGWASAERVERDPRRVVDGAEVSGADGVSFRTSSALSAVTWQMARTNSFEARTRSLNGA